MTNLYYFARSLSVHQQIDLQLRQIIKEGNRPTLIFLSNKASVQYAYEDRKTRVEQNVKYHLGPGCLVKIEFNQPVKWLKIEIEKQI
jgi:hypothetical protein